MLVARGCGSWSRELLTFLYLLGNSTTDKPSFDEKWTDLIGCAGGQDMFFLSISLIG